MNRPMKHWIQAAGLLGAVCLGASFPAYAGRAEKLAEETLSIVKALNDSLGGSIRQLRETTADLAARTESNDRDMRRLMSTVDENQKRLDRLERKFDQLTAAIYRQLNLSPPSAGQTPPADTPPLRTDVDSGGITIRPPEERRDAGRIPAPREPPAIPPRAVEKPDPNTHYRKAQELYGNQEFSRALEQFDSYLQLFPDSPRVDYAQYWKAHCAFKMGDYEFAIREFQTLRAQYPESSKMPTSMYNQAVAHTRLGQNAEAERLFAQMIDEYPDDVATESAREALIRLQELR